ncbi:unnamed protein product [Ceutorhynchus assimilis]|uniref:Uncharacterized protein n=1 Tax=Ceutorhynchus assimilis TaxID=467358 RepID=A0A9N9MDN8_9CUCU|nr:unnamed protein product [Ceutorhynchus assimilis]
MIERVLFDIPCLTGYVKINHVCVASFDVPKVDKTASNRLTATTISPMIQSTQRRVLIDDNPCLPDFIKVGQFCIKDGKYNPPRA